MDFEQQHENEYLIPQNVSTKMEILPGIGWKELGMIAVSAVVGIFICLLLGVPQKEVKEENPFNLFQVQGATIAPSPTPEPTRNPLSIITENSKEETNKYKENEIYAQTRYESLIPFPYRIMVVLLFVGIGYLLVNQSNGTSLLQFIFSYRRFNKSTKRYYFISGV